MHDKSPLHTLDVNRYFNTADLKVAKILSKDSADAQYHTKKASA